MEGRRARLRAHLLAEIRAAALDELRRTGAASLSLREVAKAAGISPSGLYRYVDGRDGLLELLISDGFEAFGAAIEAALADAGDDVMARMEAVAISYRRWALENRDQFGLILGTPVPGFHARVDGPTTASVRRFAEPMIGVVAAAHTAGGHAGTPDEAVVRSWGRVHGLVALESFGHLAWSGTDIEELLRTEVRSIAIELGVSGGEPFERTAPGVTRE